MESVQEEDQAVLTSGPPKNIRTTRRIGDRLYVAGEGPKPAKLMFIETSLLEEEATDVQETYFGSRIRQKPQYLKGPAGAIVKDTLSFTGIHMDECYFTAMCKWLLPRATRNRPKKEDIAWASEALRNEIKEVNPEIIVCFGKPVFDWLCPKYKIALKDIKGAWFYNEEFNCRVYPMEEITRPVSKPEFVEKFRIDFVEIKKVLDQINGIEVPKVPTEYLVIRNLGELVGLMSRLEAEERKVLSVDCEWAGNNHVDGQLRSMQIAWAPGKAAYIRFMDDAMNYAFDVPYEVAGAVMQPWCNRHDVRYVGHHISADFPWMHKFLGLDWYRKCCFDTEFAQQCVDEYSELSLERLAMMYTDLGRYDIDLTLWVKNNKLGPDEGYGRVPDEILIPYAMKDVDTVIRSVDPILRNMRAQGLEEYYYTYLLPFVSDVFTSFALTGLPVHRQRMDELRDLFTYAREQMDIDLRKDIHLEARSILFKELMTLDEVEGAEVFVDVETLVQAGFTDQAWNRFKEFVGAKNLLKFQPFFDHYLISPDFNIRSTKMMARWLFEVRGMTPIKTTAQREKGMPSISWEKVMSMPEERRKEFKPAVDKQTLQILGEGDVLIGKLLDLNAVGNLCKAFLKPATVDVDGELVRENGLHFWVAKDNRIHGQMSTTESGRPRAWKPNTLNFPSYVNKRISEGVLQLLKNRYEEGTLPERFDRYLTEEIPSIRACIDVTGLEPVPGSQGWCIVESDYQTAEVRGLAFISGDEKLIDLLTKPDTNFGITEDGEVVRVGFKDTGINEEAYRDVLYSVYSDGQKVRTVLDAQLVRNPDGTLKSPKADLHWVLAEMVHAKPRELLSNKKDRGSAKIGRFSSTYGASPDTLERKIESDTGIKPYPGTGQKILDALAKAQPKAEEFLKLLETYPEEPGHYRCASGRLRHFRLHPDHIAGIPLKTRSGVISSMAREARNFPFQSSVAATAARAGIWLLEEYRRRGLKSKLLTILYDSVVTMAPVEERFIVKALHEKYMTKLNSWSDHGREWNYPTDHEMNAGWSWPADEETAKKWRDPNWHSVPSWVPEEERWVA